MILELHGPLASLDHRAGLPRAILDVPAGVLADPERNRAAVPGDPFGWLSGTGLLLHARARRFGLAVVADGYLRPWDDSSGERRPPPRLAERQQHRVPRDLVCCLRCRQLALVVRAVGDGRAAGLATPSKWIRASIVHHGAELPLGARDWPARAGVPHQCSPTLFGG